MILASGAALPPDSACATSNNAACESLRNVYSQSDFNHLDQQPGGRTLLGAIWDWITARLGDLFHSLGTGGSALLLVIVVGVIVALILRRIRASRAARRLHLSGDAEPGLFTPLTQDPDAEWRAAVDAAERGNHREAIRRAFRSALLEVAHRGRLPVDPSWTTRELLRAAAGDAGLMTALAPAAELFDVAWYSGAPVTQAQWETGRSRCEAVRLLAKNPQRAVPAR